MDFDYYQIKGKWNAATLNRRAEKLEEAQAAADELEEAGAKGVEIIGVKAGKRETIRGKKNAPKPAKATKAKKAPATKKKAAKRKKTAVKMTGTTGTYTTDYNTEKKAKAAAENIRGLGFETEIVEPAGQLDLFDTDKNKDEIWRFNLNELNFISMALKEFFPNYINAPLKLTTKEYDDLINCFERAKMRGGNINIKLNENETKNIIRSLMWLKEQEHVYNKDYIQEIINGLNYGNYMV